MVTRQTQRESRKHSGSHLSGGAASLCPSLKGRLSGLFLEGLRKKECSPALEPRRKWLPASRHCWQHHTHTLFTSSCFQRRQDSLQSSPQPDAFMWAFAFIHTHIMKRTHDVYSQMCHDQGNPHFNAPDMFLFFKKCILPSALRRGPQTDQTASSLITCWDGTTGIRAEVMDASSVATWRLCGSLTVSQRPEQTPHLLINSQ